MNENKEARGFAEVEIEPRLNRKERREKERRDKKRIRRVNQLKGKVENLEKQVAKARNDMAVMLAWFLENKFEADKDKFHAWLAGIQIDGRSLAENIASKRIGIVNRVLRGLLRQENVNPDELTSQNETAQVEDQAQEL